MPNYDDLDTLVRNISLPLPPETSKPRRFNTYSELLEFFQSEDKFWTDCKGDTLKERSRELRKTVLKIQSAGEDKGRETWLAVHQALNQWCENGLPYSKSTAAAAVRRFDEIDPVIAAGALSYFMGKRPEASSREAAGVALAAQMMHGDFVQEGLTARLRVAEQVNGEARTLVEQSRKSLFDFTNSADREWNEHLAAAKVALNDWAAERERFHSAASEQLKSLEQTYSEKLRLEAPCEYWQKLSDEWRRRGRWWAGFAVALAGMTAFYAGYVAYRPPEVLKGAEYTLAGLRGALILTVGFSAAIYITTVLVRLATSAFHLSADATERRQITYVYLALLKESAITAEERQIVLSSIFSRADTGLLKTDGSPTMPTPIGLLTDAFKNK